MRFETESGPISHRIATDLSARRPGVPWSVASGAVPGFPARGAGMRSRRAPGRARALLAALSCFTCLHTADAQTEVTLVTSLTPTASVISTDTHDSTDGRVDLSQEFRTGTNAHGYALDSVTLWARRSGTIDESTITVTIRVATGDVLLGRPVRPGRCACFRKAGVPGAGTANPYGSRLPP